MSTTARKQADVSRRAALGADVRAELKAMDAAFRKVTKNRSTMIRFLAKAGIVTKAGKLTKEYR